MITDMDIAKPHFVNIQKPRLYLFFSQLRAETTLADALMGVPLPPRQIPNNIDYDGSSTNIFINSNRVREVSKVVEERTANNRLTYATSKKGKKDATIECYLTYFNFSAFIDEGVANIVTI